MINPIVDWTTKDVWDFLHYYNVQSNPLYEIEKVKGGYICKGCDRIGCICCPVSGFDNMKAELIKYPKYRDNYLRAFKKMLNKRAEKGLPIDDMWNNPYKVLVWWVGDHPDQLVFGKTPEYLKGAVDL